MLYLNQYYKATVENPDAKIEDMLIKPLFLHKTMKLPAALHHLRDRKTHMAIVIDEFGGTLGVVTVEDILEEMVGDIWDETDEIIPDIVPLGEDRFEINGDMNIDDFFYEFDYVPHDFECEYSTVGGWAIESLNSDPHVGDVFDYAHFHILVSEMEDEVRVTKLIVTVGKTEEEKEEEEEEGKDASSDVSGGSVFFRRGRRQPLKRVVVRPRTDPGGSSEGCLILLLTTVIFYDII